jgi:hypothetical protein
MVSSMYFPWLKEGVTILILGHCISSLKTMVFLSASQGQPILIHVGIGKRFSSLCNIYVIFHVLFFSSNLSIIFLPIFWKGISIALYKKEDIKTVKQVTNENLAT